MTGSVFKLSFPFTVDPQNVIGCLIRLAFFLNYLQILASFIYVSAQHPTSECDFYMYISETSVICRVLALSFCFLDLLVKQLN